MRNYLSCSLMIFLSYPPLQNPSPSPLVSLYFFSPFPLLNPSSTSSVFLSTSFNFFFLFLILCRIPSSSTSLPLPFLFLLFCRIPPHLPQSLSSFFNSFPPLLSSSLLLSTLYFHFQYLSSYLLLSSQHSWVLLPIIILP